MADLRFTERSPYLPTGSEGHRTDVEGLRALAVATVVLFHAGIPFMAGGYVGVDVFFVISGFLITGLIVREMERTGSVDLMRFYARRIRRLLPASALTLAAVAAMTFFVLPQTRWAGVAGDIRWSSGYLVNWRFADQAIDYLAADVAPSPVQHFWSLAVEEQFYLVWPFLLLAATVLARKRRGDIRRPLGLGLILIAVPSIAWSVYLTPVSPGSAYFVSTTRMWELAVGGGLAIFAPALARIPRIAAQVLAVSGLAGILLAAVTYSGATLFPGYAALLPVLATAAVIAAGIGHGDTLGARVLSWRPFVVIGGFSYALYLWHWPAIVGATAIWGDLSIVAALSVVAVATAVSWLSFSKVEQPIRKSSFVITPPRRGLVFGVLLTGVGIAAGFWLSGALPQVKPLAAAEPPSASIVESGVATGDDAPQPDSPPAADDPGSQMPPTTAAPILEPPVLEVQDTAESIFPDPLIAQDDIPDVYEQGCHQNQTDPELASCVYGSASGPVVAIAGDSHAAMWIPALRELADEYGFQLRTYTKSACAFASVDFVIGEQNIRYDSCYEWNDLLLAELTGANQPDLVVTSTSYRWRALDSAGEPLPTAEAQVLLAEGLIETWSAIQRAGVPLVVIRDVPTPRFDVPECVASNRSNLAECAYDRGEALAANTAQVTAAERTGVQLLDLADWICGPELCPVVIDDLLVWRDTHHLTATYVRYLAPVVGYELREYLVGDDSLFAASVS